jgi:hypothetical protein
MQAILLHPSHMRVKANDTHATRPFAWMASSEATGGETHFPAWQSIALQSQIEWATDCKNSSIQLNFLIYSVLHFPNALRQPFAAHHVFGI